MDTESDRYYFVDQICLSSLKVSGLVAQIRYRQSAEVAYRVDEVRGVAVHVEPSFRKEYDCPCSR